MNMTVKWLWKAFDELDLEQLYELLALRNEVFVVEQNSVYNDTDGLDQQAWHLLGYDSDCLNSTDRLVVYLRVLPPQVAYEEAASIGRVVVRAWWRHNGLAREAMNRALDFVSNTCPCWPLKIAAQRYLEPFYQHYGFETVSGEYQMDGLPHVDMLRCSTG